MRQNAIALLALVIATGTGTAYAASQIPNGSVTTKKLAKNAVTTPKIKKNAVTGAKIKNRSVTAKDLKVGVLPKDGYVFTRMEGASESEEAPEVVRYMGSFSLPRAGTAVITVYSSDLGLTCSGGLSGRGGLFVGPAPSIATATAVSGTSVVVDESSVVSASRTLIGTVNLDAGEHHLMLGFHCPAGLYTSAQYFGLAFQVSLVPN